MLLVSQPTKESAHEFHGWWKTVHISPPQGDPHQSSRELRQIWNPCLMTYLRIGHLCLNRSWRILLIAHQHPPLESNATHEGNKQNNDDICTNLMSLLAGEAPGITSDCEASEELSNNTITGIEVDSDEQPPANKRRKVDIISPAKTRRRVSQRKTLKRESLRSMRQNQAAKPNRKLRNSHLEPHNTTM